MSYPYSSLYLEAYRARQRLTQALRDQGSEGPSLPSLQGAGAKNEQEQDFGTNTASKSNSTNKDISTNGFVLALLLFGTIAAVQTDQPTFWLLIGPAPLLVGFAAIAFLRQRFDSRSRVER
jgi:hypothetical protein